MQAINKALLAAVFLVGSGVVGVCAQSAGDDLPPAEAKAQEAAAIEPQPADLSGDARLLGRVKFDVQSGTLTQLCAGVRAATKINLSAAESLRGRRVTVLAPESTSVVRAMGAAARATNATWYPAENEDGAYVLRQSPDDLAREEKWIQASEKRENRILAQREQKVTAQINQALSERDKNKPSFGDVLAALPEAKRRQAIQISNLPLEIFGTDNGEMDSRLIGAKPLSEWPKPVQNLVRQKTTPSQAGNSAVPAGEAARQVLTVGATPSGLRLALINPETMPDRFLFLDDLPLDAPSLDTLNDNDPNVVEKLRRGNLLDFGDLSSAIRRKKLRFDEKVNRRYLSGVLAAVARQTGLTIVADDYWRTRTTKEAEGLLRDQPEYTLKDALQQIAVVFGHTMVYRNGVLLVQTLTPGGDLRAEPPSDLLERLETLYNEKKPLAKADYRAIGLLSSRQLETFALALPEKLPEPRSIFFAAYWNYPPYHLYALLTPEQQAVAQSDSGLAAEDLTPEQRPFFDLIAGVGLPDNTPPPAPRQPNHFYAKIQDDTPIKQMNFWATGAETPVSATRTMLSWH